MIWEWPTLGGFAGLALGLLVYFAAVLWFHYHLERKNAWDPRIPKAPVFPDTVPERVEWLYLQDGLKRKETKMTKWEMIMWSLRRKDFWQGLIVVTLFTVVAGAVFYQSGCQIF